MSTLRISNTFCVTKFVRPKLQTGKGLIMTNSPDFGIDHDWHLNLADSLAAAPAAIAASLPSGALATESYC